MKDMIKLEGKVFECSRLIEQRFEISGHTRRAWVNAGIIGPPIRLGRKYFFDRQEIEKQILATRGLRLVAQS